MVILKSQTRVKLTRPQLKTHVRGVQNTQDHFKGPHWTRVLSGSVPRISDARPPATATASCKRAHQTKPFNRAIHTQNMPHSIGHSSTRTHPNRPRTWAGSTGQTRKSTGRARCTHCDSTSTRKQHAHIGRYCSAMRSKRNESRTASHAAPHARIRTAQEHGQTPKGWRERASEARAATAGPGRAPPGEEERIRPANARGAALFMDRMS